MHTQPMFIVHHQTIVPRHHPPAISWRGILVGLWLICSSTVVLALVPGIGLELGNLPGDIDAGSGGSLVRVPIVTITLLLVTLTGIYYRISSYLSRH